MELPFAFVESTRRLMGDDRFDRYLTAFDEEPPVSVRLNPLKGLQHAAADAVPWCRDAYYLATRPNFTFDPLLHAGCYYVQEASSMFLDEVLRQHAADTLPADGLCLDLCAAPGGKSTLLRSALPATCPLISNEPVRQRASILQENVQKWGYGNHLVTNLYPRDFRKSRMLFDLILCDVPCSGEGMFRKDPQTIAEWSPQNVDRCRQLQRDIVADAWVCLADGGLLIYSTCTFNIKENEENIRWMLDTMDAEVLPVQTRAEWHITGSLLADFDVPVYRFIPGITRGEGLFMCVLRKHGGSRRQRQRQVSVPVMQPQVLHVDGPRAELTYRQAIAYLRREALVLAPDVPRGLVEVTFRGHPLGAVKNLGTRANNLYPKEWRIKTTHVPDDYQPVVGM